MAWDTEATRKRLHDAALQQFTETGLSGTRVERIAERAGLNKALIYKYFGSKEQMFSTVVAQELEQIAAAVPLLGRETDDIGEYAGACFDYHCEHPALVRLLSWEALEAPGGTVALHAEARQADYAQKVAGFTAAQRAGTAVDDVPAGDLLFVVMAMAAWWTCVPQVAQMITGQADDTPGERARRRESVVRLARRLAAGTRDA